MEAASFTDFDSEVLAVQPPPFKVEIVAELLGTEDVNNDNDDTMKTADEPVYCSDRNGLLQVIETVQKFFLFSKDGAIVQSHANHVARINDRRKASKEKLEIIFRACKKVF